MAEQRLIDANVLKMDLPTETTEDECITEAVCKIIDKQPTVETVPVVHGHWSFTEYEYFDCSVCGDSYYTGAESSAQARSYLNSGHFYKFCPHCGAKMDEVSK